MSCEDCPNKDYCIPDECTKNDRPQRQLRTAKNVKTLQRYYTTKETSDEIRWRNT